MASLVLIDGEPVAPEQARVSVFDRGFLYGDSVFETLRTYRGEPFALGAHLERFRRSAEQVFIPLPVPLEVFEKEIRRAVRLSGNAESTVRFMLTRGRASALGLDPDLSEHPLRVVIVNELATPPAEVYERGIRAVTYRTQRLTDATGLSEAKVGNYLLAVLAMREARQAGAAEALIVDARGRLIEGATSNVFLVEGGSLVTPPEGDGILLGITRAEVLSLAAELGLAVALRSIELGELDRAEEAFICSSVREIVPVVAVDGRSIGAGVPGPLTRRLIAAFRARVH